MTPKSPDPPEIFLGITAPPRRIQEAQGVENSGAPTSCSPSPCRTAWTDEDILAALDEIPQEFRSVALLVDVEGFAYKEVAGFSASRSAR
jgi:DNA-directed RNA polymerase specialized sigma24 family protein